MDWLMPAESNMRGDLNLGGGVGGGGGVAGFDSIYKPYSVEPLVSRYNFGSVTSMNNTTSTNGLGSTMTHGGVGGGLAPLNPRRNNPINSLRNLGRNAALDDIDELTLAVETKNFLGSQAIPIPSTNYMQQQTNNQTVNNGSNFLNDMYADTYAGNQETILIGSNPLLNANNGRGGPAATATGGPGGFPGPANLYQSNGVGNYNGNFMSNPAPASLSTIYGSQPPLMMNNNLGSLMGGNGTNNANGDVSTHDYMASPTKMFLSNPLFNKDVNNNAAAAGLPPKLRSNGSSEHRSSDYDPYQSLKYQPSQFRSLSNGSYHGQNLQPLGVSQQHQQFAPVESPNHNNHQQRLIQYQNRIAAQEQQPRNQYQQYQPSGMMMNNGGNNNNYDDNFNDEINDYGGQLPPRPPYQNGTYGNNNHNGNNGIYSNNQNNGYFNNDQQFSNKNDWNMVFNDNQMKKKHYSELSIQSTSADPLNSNAPTPLVNTNGSRRQASNNNNNQQYQSNFNKNLVNTNSINKPMEGVGNNSRKPNGTLPGIKQNGYSNNNNNYQMTNSNRSNNNAPSLNNNPSQRTRRNGSNEFINNIYSASSVKSGPNGQTNRSQQNGKHHEPSSYNVSSNLNNQTRENKVKSKSLNNGLNENHHHHRPTADNYYDVLNYKNNDNIDDDMADFNSASNNGGFNFVDDNNQFINNYQQKNNGGYQNGSNNNSNNNKLKRNSTINGNQLGGKNQGDDFYRNYVAMMREREKRNGGGSDKYTPNDYRNFQRNGGFGFRDFESETKQEKLEKKRKESDYARQVRERNASLASSNMSTGGGQQRYSNNSISSINNDTGYSNSVNNKSRNNSKNGGGGLNSYSRYTEK